MIASEETTGSRTIRIKSHSIPAQDRKEFLLTPSNNGIIVPLEDAGLDPAVLLANVNEPLDFLGFVVAEAPALDLALFVRLVHGLARFFKWSLPVRHVEVLDVDLRDLQVLE